ncbi:MAG TPA: GAF domain-containing protein, partial [Candidatus Limnocylindria bacterium]|nr:GAF domain-containing protein [Candidatus Limnocylindria bacterium]
CVPLLSRGKAIGALSIARIAPGRYPKNQIALAKTFANQAVIAIENTRLFRELQDRNAELKQSLDFQGASGEILASISSSITNAMPVFEAIVSNVLRLFGTRYAGVFLLRGGMLELAAVDGDAQFAQARNAPLRRFRDSFPQPVDDGTLTGKAMLSGQIMQLAPIIGNPEATPQAVSLAKTFGYDAIFIAPLVRHGKVIGAIGTAHPEARRLHANELQVLKAFADQAVIAIENARLFNETKEALEQQTATAEILRVISSSPDDIQPVFDSIVEHAMRLCDAGLGTVGLYDGRSYRHVAQRGSSPEYVKWLFSGPFEPGPNSTLGRIIAQRQPFHIADYKDLSYYREGDPRAVATVELGGARTFLAVPMVKEERVIGAITIRRAEVRPFTQKQIDLVSTFASQAVIAIENVRLFQELQARTQDLSQSLEETGALSEVIRAVSSSLDLREVLDAVARRAVTLAGADGCGIFEYSPARGTFAAVVSHGISRRFLDTIPVGMDQGTLGRATQSGEPVQVADVQAVPDYPFRDRFVEEGLRAVLTVPMTGGDVARGIVLFRRTPGEFDERVVTLMRTLADQSKVAIANAHLFREIEEKGRLLEVANQHKSEFLANMSHELRTPLNAIIGFSEVLLQRMFGELNPKQDEYLQDVLSSGRHLLSLINDILDLSKVEAGRMELELERFDLPQALQDTLVLVRERAARHGIDLHLDADARLGALVADERKIKQVLLNLLSNAVKFTPEGGRVEVRAVPTDGAVEISVTDTGIGIAPENQELIFEEFRQVGGDYAHKREGTGLGLTLARKLVELHGGRLWVKSQVGQGSTFTFSVPERPWPAS